MKNKFTKDSMVIEVIRSDENDKYKNILMGFGLHCFGCPMSQMETLEEASLSHDVDIELMLNKLNNA